MQTKKTIFIIQYFLSAVIIALSVMKLFEFISPDWFFALALGTVIAFVLSALFLLFGGLLSKKQRIAYWVAILCSLSIIISLLAGCACS